MALNQKAASGIICFSKLNTIETPLQISRNALLPDEVQRLPTGHGQRCVKVYLCVHRKTKDQVCHICGGAILGHGAAA
jgi:hypothetical protein